MIILPDCGENPQAGGPKAYELNENEINASVTTKTYRNTKFFDLIVYPQLHVKFFPFINLLNLLPLANSIYEFLNKSNNFK